LLAIARPAARRRVSKTCLGGPTPPRAASVLCPQGTNAEYAQRLGIIQ
jgi:hypothetical protein